METVGQKIRKYRKEKDLTQTQLAELVGVRQGLIALYETGAKTPNNITRDKIANALGIPYLYLRDAVFYEPPPEEDWDNQSYLDFFIDLDGSFAQWMDLVLRCKESLTEEEFKQFFTETQNMLNKYRIALDMNILIDDVDRYRNNMQLDDLKEVYKLPYKYLKNKPLE
jgi:Predicted transcriptional regulator with C-terminal CBS domains